MQNSIVDIKIEIDSSGAVKKVETLTGSIDKLNKKTKENTKESDNFSKSIASIKDATFVASGALTAFGVASFKSFSDLNETINKSKVVFGEFYGEFEAQAKTANRTLGMSERAYLQMASTFGAMGNSMGLAKEQSKDYAKSLTNLAGDIASFNNLSIDQAETALKGIYTGETESLKTLGYSITENTLKQYGYNKKMTEAEKIAVRYKAIIDQTKDAHGDAARTIDEGAGSMRQAQANMENLAATIGGSLEPVMLPLLNDFNKFLNNLNTYITNNPQAVEQIIRLSIGFLKLVAVLTITSKVFRTFKTIFDLFYGGIPVIIKGIKKLGDAFLWTSGKISKGLTGVVGGFKVLTSGIKKNTIALLKNTVAFLTTPIGWITVGVMALIGALILLWQNWDFVVEMFNIGVQKVVEFVKGIPAAIGGFIGQVWESIKNFFKMIIQGVVNFIKSIPTLISQGLVLVGQFIGTVVVNILGLFILLGVNLLKFIFSLPGLIWSVITTVRDAVLGFIFFVGEEILKFIFSLPGLIWNLITTVGNMIGSWVSWLGETLLNLIFSLPGMIWNAIIQIPTLIRNALILAIDVLKWFAGRAFDMFTLPFRTGINIIGFVMENGKSIVNGFLEYIKFSFKTAVNVMTMPFRTLISVINKVIEGINKVQVPDWVPIIGGQGINIPMLPNIPAFAKGTNFAPGGVSLVGEEGPELVNLPRGSQVIPHAQTMAQLNGAKGGNSIYLSFNVDTSNSVVPGDFANSIINSTVNVVENKFGSAFKGVLV